MSLRYSARIYRKIQRNWLTSLPNDPLNLSKHSNSPLIKFLVKIKLYAHTKDFEPLIRKELLFFIKNQPKLQAFQSTKEIGNYLSLIKKTEGIEGDIIELGIAHGGTTTIIAHFLKKIKSTRRVYACDTFEGLPYEDKFSKESLEKVKARYAATYSDVSKKIKSFGVNDKIELIKGLFEDTLYSQLSTNKFSFVIVDCDLYDAAKFCLEFVYPQVSKDGIIVFDDYGGGGARDMKRGRWGETMAVDEFCIEKKIKLHLDPEPMIIKKD